MMTSKEVDGGYKMFQIDDEVMYKGGIHKSLPIGIRGKVTHLHDLKQCVVSFPPMGEFFCFNTQISLMNPALQAGDKVEVIGPIGGIVDDRCLGCTGVIKSVGDKWVLVDVALADGFAPKLSVMKSSLKKIGVRPKGSIWWI